MCNHYMLFVWQIASTETGVVMMPTFTVTELAVMKTASDTSDEKHDIKTIFGFQCR